VEESKKANVQQVSSITQWVIVFSLLEVGALHHLTT